MLAEYLTNTKTLLGTSAAQFWAASDLTTYINTARKQVAAEGQCIKVLPPSTNGVAAIVVTAGGTYSGTPTVVITGNGTGATATANMLANAVDTITVTAAGSLYDKSTTISFTGGGETAAATATATVNCLNTVAAQEVYTFAAANTFAALTSGVSSILFVESVAVSWGALKPVLNQWNWNDLQARVRAYPIQSGQPAIWSQFGQGIGGSIYLQPVPTSILPMEWNCVCIPIALVDDNTAEAIPYPWTDCVPYFAAYLGMMNARRPEEAKNMFAVYEQMMMRARAFSESSFVPSYYA